MRQDNALFLFIVESSWKCCATTSLAGV